MSEARRGWLSSISSLPSLVFPRFSWFSHGSPDRSSDLAAGSWPVVFSYNTPGIETTSETLIDTSSTSTNCDPDHGRKVIRADRPRNYRRPWLPSFRKLKRHYPVRHTSARNQGPTETDDRITYRRRPRLASLPRQRFLIDTKYPRLLPSDTRIDDIRYALGPLHEQQSQNSPVPQAPGPAPRGLRPTENQETDFIDINGIRTNKRRAEDTEVDLVAALQDSKHIDRPPSSVTTSREGFRPDSECLFQKKLEVNICHVLSPVRTQTYSFARQAHMSKTRPLAELFTGMMTNILSSFADLTGRFRRLRTCFLPLLH